MPDIIDEVTFNKAYAKIKGNKRGPRVGGKNFYLLTGYLYCGSCESRYVGCSYRGGRGGKKYPIYECSKRDRTNCCNIKAIHQFIIEELLIKDLLENVFAPEEAKKISKRLVDMVKEYDQESQKELVYIQKALTEANSKIEKLIDTVVDGIFDKSIIKDKMDKLKHEKAQLESRLHEIQFKSYDWVDEDKIYQFLMRSKENLLSGDNLLKRKVNETFIDKIKIYPNRIDSNIKVAMLSSPDTERGKTGGGEGNRTPVRNHIHSSFSGCILYFAAVSRFPCETMTGGSLRQSPTGRVLLSVAFYSAKAQGYHFGSSGV
jgi:site-specific DNA recombinase